MTIKAPLHKQHLASTTQKPRSLLGSFHDLPSSASRWEFSLIFAKLKSSLRVRQLPLPDSPASPRNHCAARAQKARMTSACNELQGRRRSTPVNLSQARITSIPLSIDPCGSPGCFATRLLFDPPPDKPHWHELSVLTSEAAFQARSAALKLPRTFLKIANSKSPIVSWFWS